MSVFLSSIKNILNNINLLISLCADKQYSISGPRYKFFIFFLPLLIFTPFLSKDSPVIAAEMSDEGKHSNVLIFKEGRESIKVFSGKMIFPEDSEGREKRSFQSKEGFICFLPLHQGEGVSVVPAGQLHSDEIRSDCPGNDSTNASNVRRPTWVSSTWHIVSSVLRALLIPFCAGALFLFSFLVLGPMTEKFLNKHFPNLLK